MPNVDPDLRFFVDGSLSADDIVNQIKNLYPRIKEEKDTVLIEIVIGKSMDPSIIEEIGKTITEDEIIEFRDRLYFTTK